MLHTMTQYIELLLLSFPTTLSYPLSTHLLLRIRRTQSLAVFWVLFPFGCRYLFSSQMSLFHTSFMSRSLAEARAKARKTPFSGSGAFVPPSLPLPEGRLPKPRLSTNPQNCIIPSSLRPHVPAIQCFTHWLTPYRIAQLDSLSSLFPPDIIVRHCLCI